MSEYKPDNNNNFLSDTLTELFNSVIVERETYYRQHNAPHWGDVDRIINDYAQKNMIISGGASLIPGPWGLVAVVPEIAFVIKNQLMMIYDIGAAYNKREVLDRDLLGMIFAYSVCSGGIAYITMSGGRVLVKRVSLRLFQQLIEMTAGRITQRLIKSAISKWLPVAGAAIMAGWSYYSTYEIGKKAVSIFDKPIDFDGSTSAAMVMAQ